MAVVTLQQLDDRTRERADQVYASTITTSAHAMTSAASIMP
jgi:hypothetical protein